MLETTLFFKYAVSLAIGILIGLQREFFYDEPAAEMRVGVRTLGLLSLFGCTAAHVSFLTGSVWPVSVGCLVAGVFFSLYFYVRAVHCSGGLTTSVAGVLTYCFGVLVYYNHATLAVALGVTTTVLLTGKGEIHTFVSKMTKADVYATLKFAVISAIILPVLPNQTYGPEPFHIFNPFKIWLIIVFISALSFSGYILIKWIGAKKGIAVMGFLGGIISSTAVTSSFVEKSRGNPALSGSFTSAILMAWTVMFIRIAAIVWALNTPLGQAILAPLVFIIIISALLCLFYYFRQISTEGAEGMNFSNPFELGSAVQFGLLLVGIYVLSNAAQIHFGNAGVLLSSFFSGLADVDAVAVSVAQMSLPAQTLSQGTAAQAIFLVLFSNTATKGSMVLLYGAKPLKWSILPGLILLLMLCAAAVFLF